MSTSNIRIGADASATRLAVVPETTWGTTPSTPSFTSLRITGETLAPVKETVRTNELRADRNVTDEIMTARSSSGEINFELSYGTFDHPLFTSLFTNDWEGSPDDTLKNGTTGNSMTLERTLNLGGGTSEYIRFVGCLANTMSLEITAGQIVTGSFGILGKFGSRGSSIISGATYTDANDNVVLNATSNFASLSVGSLSPTPRIRSLSLSVTNNLRQQQVVGDLDAAGMGAGRFEVTGNMEAYFQSSALFQSFLDHDDLSLSFVLGSASGSRYRFTIPTIKLTGNPGANAGGNDQDVMLTLPFTAIYDRTTSPSLGCTLQLERGV